MCAQSLSTETFSPEASFMSRPVLGYLLALLTRNICLLNLRSSVQISLLLIASVSGRMFSVFLFQPKSCTSCPHCLSGHALWLWSMLWASMSESWNSLPESRRRFIDDQVDEDCFLFEHQSEL